MALTLHEDPELTALVAAECERLSVPGCAVGVLAGGRAYAAFSGVTLEVEASREGLVLHLPGQRPLPLSPQSGTLWATPAGVVVEFAPTGPGDSQASLTVRPAGAFTARRAEPFT